MTRNQLLAAARKQLVKSKKSMEHLIHGGRYRPPRGEYNAHDAIDSIDRRLAILESGSDEEIAAVVAREIGEDYLAAK